MICNSVFRKLDAFVDGECSIERSMIISGTALRADSALIVSLRSTDWS